MSFSVKRNSEVFSELPLRQKRSVGDDFSMEDEQIKYLMALAQHLKDESPAESRFLMSKANNLRADMPMGASKQPKNPGSCSYCGSIFQPENHRVRLQPKVKLSKKLAKLLKRAHSDSSRLGKLQQSLVEKFQQKQNKMVITCESCKKKTVIPIQHKEKRKLPTTPGSEAKKKKKRKKSSIDDVLPGAFDQSPFLTSTPQVNTKQSSVKIGQERISQNARFSSSSSNNNSSNNNSSLSFLSSSGASNNSMTKKKKYSAKDAHRKLQNILANQESGSKKKGGSLQDFLMSV